MCRLFLNGIQIRVYAQQNAGMTHGKISRIASQLWKAMPASVKDGYKRRSERALDDFYRDLAAYKECCAAQGKRPKFSVGGDGGREKKPSKGWRDSLEEDPDVSPVSKTKSKKGGRGKHPEVTPWFALVMDDKDDSTFRLLEVFSGVHSDGSCKAREWLLHDVVETEMGLEVTRFAAASLYPQMMELPVLGWLPVEVLRSVKSELEAAGNVRPSPVEVFEGADEHEAFVVILNEAQCLTEACRILAGELELEPFPAKEAPPTRVLGIHKVAASPQEYLRKVEQNLLPASPGVYTKFLAMLTDFKRAVDAGAKAGVEGGNNAVTVRTQARRAAIKEVGILFRESPLNRLMAGFDLFLREQVPACESTSSVKRNAGMSVVEYLTISKSQVLRQDIVQRHIVASQDTH